MIRATYRRAIANIRSRPAQTILVGAVIAAGSALIVIAGSLNQMVDSLWDDVYAQGNGPDVIVGSADRALTETLLIEAGGIQVSGPQAVAWNLRATRGTRSAPFASAVSGFEPLEVGEPVIVDGTWLSKVSGQVVIDRGLANRLDAAVGDLITVSGDGGSITTEVVGIAINTVRPPFPIWDPALGYMSESDTRAVQPDLETWRWNGMIKLSDPGSASQVVRAIETAHPDSADEVGAITRFEIAEEAGQAANIFSILIGGFALLVLAATGFIILNVVAGQVFSQSREVGLLKAVGFTPFQTSVTHLVQNGLTAIVFATLGSVAGMFIAPLMLSNTISSLGGGGTSVSPQVIAVSILFVTSLVIVFTLIPAWRSGRVSTVRLIRGDTGRGAGRSRIAGLARALGAPPSLTIGVRDAFGHRGRAILSIAAMVVAVAVLIPIGSFQRMFSSQEILAELGAPPYEVSVSPGIMERSELELIIENLGGVENIHTVNSWIARTPNGPSFNIRVIDGDYASAGYAMQSGRLPEKAGEATIGWGLSDELDVAPGDTLAIEVEGVQVDLDIVGQQAMLSNSGRMLFIPASTFDGTPLESKTVDLVAVKLDGSVTQVEFKSRLLEAADGRVTVETFEEEEEDLRRTFTVIVAGVAIVMVPGTKSARLWTLESRLSNSTPAVG